MRKDKKNDVEKSDEILKFSTTNSPNTHYKIATNAKKTRKNKRI